jgi:general secretion pathway protein D
MMRAWLRSSLLGAFLAFGAGSALAAVAPVFAKTVSPSSLPLSFDFASVPVMQFAQAVYSDSLGRDFVVSADLIDSQKKVSIRVKSLPADKLAGFVDHVLRSQGISSTLRDGVYYLDALHEVAGQAGDVASAPGDVGQPDAKPVVPDKVLVLRAQNRPAEFLAASLGAVFGPGAVKLGAGSVLVVSVPEAKEAIVREVLDALDSAPRSVEVVASFVEVTRSSDEARGLSLVNAALSRKFGVSFDASVGQASIVSGSFQLVLDALSSDGRFKQVSNSRVVGDEGEKLSLLVGDETPTIASTAKDNQGNPIQSVVYRPSGVILDVQPRVTGSGRLSLSVDGQVSAFQTTKTGVAGSPTLVKRQVKTAVSLDDGKVLVIGGLDDSKVSDQASGFSFLPKSWRSRSGDDRKTDLVLILSARVLR